MADGFSINGKNAKSFTAITTEYVDGYGLQYSLEEKDPLEAPTTTLEKVGKLSYVTYRVPEYLEKRDIYIDSPVQPVSIPSK